MKRILSFVLSLVLVLSLIPSTFAASNEANEAAQSLYELGLFNGTGTDANGNPIFDLDRAPTRHEAVTMLVRLLGKGEEAESGTWNTPFTDVADWAKPYVGYAYTNGLTAGTSATTYSGNNTVTASEYLTFVLRALGYSSGTDFQWDRAWELSDSLGITNGQYNAGTTSFTRGDVAIISENALHTQYKNDTKTLMDVLVVGGSVDVGNVLPQQGLSLGNLRFIKYQDDLYYVDFETVDGGSYSISGTVWYDDRTSEVYIGAPTFSVFYPFHISDEKNDNPFVDGTVIFTVDKSNYTWREEYTSFASYYTVYSYTFNGKTFQSMSGQEYADGNYEDGDCGVYNGIRFSIASGRCWYNVNDLAEYFGIDYRFSYEPTDTYPGYIIMTEI